MKRAYLLTAIFILAYFVLGEWFLHAEQTDKHSVPVEFVSQVEAEMYVSDLFAGGRVLILMVGKRQVLVIQIYGSGVPDIAFAAYAFSEGHWVLKSEFFPGKTGQITESHDITVKSDELVVVGSQSGQQRVLFKADDNGNILN